MEAIWEQQEMPRFPVLQGDLQTDVLIVGGGMAGLLCAYNLTRAGVDCVLIEQDRIMSGVSGRTTAKLTSQHGLVYEKIMRRYGWEKARLYWQANEAALGAFGALAQELEFDFEKKDHYLYATTDTAALEREMSAYEQLEIPARWEPELPLPFPTVGALKFTNQAQMDPMKLAAQLAPGLKIYEQTKALRFAGKRVTTPQGRIRAEKIIIATHFPMLNKHGGYFLKLYQQRSYVLALENAGNVEGMYWGDGPSLRNVGDILLLGGSTHRTGKPGQGWQPLETFAQKDWPNARQVTRWATQDCISLDGIPYIGQYSLTTPDLFVATGFNKWGMTSSMVAAMILTDMVQEKESPYAEVFTPARTMLHSQLFANISEATGSLFRFSKPRCPHLGCALQWNAQEHSWDCPCHGSRFDEQGKRLNNPATGDLKKTKF